MLSYENEIKDFIKDNWGMVLSEIVSFYGFCSIKAYDSLGSYTFIAEIDEDNKHIRDIWME